MEILEYTGRLDQLHALIERARPDHRRDLMKMFQNLKNDYLLLQCAAIECRRLHTITAGYRTLAERFDQNYSEVEQMTTLALLL